MYLNLIASEKRINQYEILYALMVQQQPKKKQGKIKWQKAQTHNGQFWSIFSYLFCKKAIEKCKLNHERPKNGTEKGEICWKETKCKVN